MELTRKYFDQQLKQQLKQELSEQLKNLVTKDHLTAELQKQSKELKAYSEEQTEILAQIIANTIVEPMERHFAKFKDRHIIRNSMTAEL